MSRRRSVALTAAATGLLLVVGAAPAQAATAMPLSTGSDAYGQQGNGAGGSRTTPGPVAVPSGMTAIASGRDHGYALDAQGRVWAWGLNDKGQLGDGTWTARQAPVQVVLAGGSPLTGIVHVEAGHYHGLALHSSGAVYAWGFNQFGQLGIGTTANSQVARQVTLPAGAGIAMVAGGRDMSYAVRTDGSVLAWGNNAQGELGDGTRTRQVRPRVVPNLTGVVDLGVGRNHVLTRTATGRIFAWGDNAYGQVGNGSTVDQTRPVQLAPTGVRNVDAGAHHSIAVLNDGRVLTWGRGYRGQLGLGSTSARTTPTVVPDVPAAVEVGDGRDTSFAITASGDVWAWGDNGAGQLGLGDTTRRLRPARVPSVSGIAFVQGGALHTVLMPITG